ncbi:MAG: DUF1822 family protein [Gomphosphaeria aponina SAG 52.96 = DSM 107014]|uniref:DUF1822 family protein n=1 Tax=Gomphosphaeria aponina SAG 52.96 = DSM 107014 TaxID=1521640 RepID=A0A941GQW1_9CHRO|nr:DUF1822 family protein [Gomphosphaeria aponina SAG 52.96 = DSM 107014]
MNTTKLNHQIAQGILLEISPESQNLAWEETEAFSCPGNRWQAYLNRLSLEGILAWLAENYTGEASVWKSEELPSIWEFVNGSAITINDKRIVILPCSQINCEYAADEFELAIPGEWVEIPSWAGDYYLAVQINVEVGIMRILAYTTQRKIQEKAVYDRDFHLYYLEQKDLILDPNVLLLSLDFCQEQSTKGVITTPQQISPMEAEKLLAKLGNPELVLPKRQVFSGIWNALLANDTWRLRMYRKRALQTRLTQWMNHFVEESWKTVELLLGGPEPEPEPIRFRLRRKDDLDFRDAFKRGKEIDFGMRLAGKTVSLVVSVKQESSEITHIRLRVYPYPRGENIYLPPNFKLVILDEAGKPVLDDSGTPLAAESRAADNWIQLQLYGTTGEEFSVHLSLENASVTEYFVI